MLDDDRTTKIVEVIRSGGSRESAAAAANVSPRTLWQWLSKGRAGEPDYVQFAQAVKKADGDAEQAMVRIVREAAEMGTWQAAAWWLERRRGKRYALKRDMKVEVTKPLSEEEARAKVKEILGVSYEELEAAKQRGTV